MKRASKSNMRVTKTKKKLHTGSIVSSDASNNIKMTVQSG